MNLNWRTVITFFFITSLIGLQVVYWINPFTLQDLVYFRDELFYFVQEHSIVSAFIYILIYTVSIVFGIPLSATIIGGYLFGIWYGVVYTVIAIVIGSTCLCSFARYVMHDPIEKRYKDKLKFFNSEIQKYGILYIIMIHAIPFAPSFLPHIAAGLSSLALYKIILANSIGALPLTIIYAAAGNYLHTLTSLQSFTIYMSIFGFLILSLWGVVILLRYVVNKE